MSHPIHIDDAEFQAKVLDRRTPVIVDFWAPWCGPCHMIAPLLDKLALEYGDRLVIAKVNTDKNGQWASYFGVQGIPTLLFIRQGKVIHEQVGALPEPHLRRLVDRFPNTPDGAAA